MSSPSSNSCQTSKGPSPSIYKPPVVHCTVHEDNKGCIHLMKLPQVWTRAKCIALKHHHFPYAVKDKIISVRYVESSQQIHNVFTKLINDTEFGVLWEMVVGW